MPEMVGMRGSSQPFTRFSFTSWMSQRFDSTVFVRFSRANSICRDGYTGRFRTHQSYSGLWFSNSSEQQEWVIPSSASDSGWA